MLRKPQKKEVILHKSLPIVILVGSAAIVDEHFRRKFNYGLFGLAGINFALKQRLYHVFSCSFRRGAPSRHEGRGPRGRDGFPGPDDFGPEDNFDSSDDNSRGRDHGGRGRGRGTPRGKGAFFHTETHELVHGNGKMVLGVIVIVWVQCFLFSISCCTGGRKGLLPTPDEFPRFEGRKPESWDGNREPGKNVGRIYFTACLALLHSCI